MNKPNDAFGTPLEVGDSAELIEDVAIGAQRLPKGRVLHRLRHWYNDFQVEFDSVQTEVATEDLVIPTRSLRKLP